MAWDGTSSYFDYIYQDPSTAFNSFADLTQPSYDWGWDWGFSSGDYGQFGDGFDPTAGLTSSSWDGFLDTYNYATANDWLNTKSTQDLSNIWSDLGWDYNTLLGDTSGMDDSLVNSFLKNITSNLFSPSGGGGGTGDTGSTGGLDAGLLALLGGGLLGSLSGDQQAGITETKQVPWDLQQPYLLDMFEQAKALSDAGYQQNPYETAGIEGFQSALDSPLGQTSQDYISSLYNNINPTNMPYTGSNPYLGYNPQQATNPYIDQMKFDPVNYSLNQNPYIGQTAERASNPYIDQMQFKDINYNLNQNSYLGSTTPQASNSFIGQTAGQMTNPYIDSLNVGQLGNYQASNPYINQIGNVGDLQAGYNPLYGLNNPYLNSAINNAQNDVIQRYQDVTKPQLDAAQVTQGAFGNTGLQQTQNQALSDLTENLGKISTDMRMQDYGLQAQLGESDVQRRMAADQYNISNDYNTSLQKASMYGDLSKYNTGMNYQTDSQNIANQYNADQLKAQLYNQLASTNLSASQNDLARNAQLQQALSQYNSSLYSNDIQRNASLEDSYNQMLASGQYNADQFNSTTGLNTIQNQANLYQNLSQYNSGLSSTDLQRNSSLMDAYNQMLASGQYTADSFNSTMGLNTLQNQANLYQNLSQYNSGLDSTAWTQNSSLYNQDALRNIGQYQYGTNMLNNTSMMMPNYINSYASPYNTLYTMGSNYNMNSYYPTSLYGNLVNGQYGQTTQTPYYNNPYANMLGGAMTGLSLYNQWQYPKG